MGVPDFVGHHGEETKEEYISTTALELAESSVLYTCIPLKEVMILKKPNSGRVIKGRFKRVFIYLLIFLNPASGQ